jgi:hypothetical protein
MGNQYCPYFMVKRIQHPNHAAAAGQKNAAVKIPAKTQQTIHATKYK